MNDTILTTLLQDLFRRSVKKHKNALFLLFLFYYTYLINID